jgi:hypothetical protein
VLSSLFQLRHECLTKIIFPEMSNSASPPAEPEVYLNGIRATPVTRAYLEFSADLDRIPEGLGMPRAKKVIEIEKRKPMIIRRWLTGAIVFLLGALLGFAFGSLYSPSNRHIAVSPVVKVLPPVPFELRGVPSSISSEDFEQASRNPDVIEAKPPAPSIDAYQKEPEKSGEVPQQGDLSFVYTICLDSFRDPTRARKRMQFLQSLGLEAFTHQIDLPGKGIFHRVLVGKFQDRGEVEAMQKRLKKEFDLPTGWVISGSTIDR